MLTWTIIKVALKSLLANKLRSFLAMLGIIIGVAAVISMLAIGAGAEQQVTERISSMGTNLLVINPGMRRRHGVRSSAHQNLVLEDARVLLEKIPGIQEVAPTVTNSAQAKYFNKNTNTTVLGSSVTYFGIRNYEIERGRAFTEGEAEQMARVAVIGSVTAENLFGKSDPIDEIIKIKNINFRVVGLLKSKGGRGWSNPDEQILVPYTIAMKQLFGLDHLRSINVQVRDGEDIESVQEEIRKVMRQRHRLREDAEDDFRIFNQAELLEDLSGITRTFTILLGSIAGISLLVGGIGIMNIMLVTVTERTREIGIRKAIGAKPRDILGQFLVEAVIMSALGGFFGVLLGAGGAKLLENMSDFVTLMKPGSVILAISFSAVVGVFFGFYPAKRAAGLDPIEALRYE